jgi:uncharacterized protein YbaP (TraB family)
MGMTTFFRVLLAGALLLSATARAFAQDACPPPAPTQASVRPEQLRSDVRDRGFLWQLTRDGRVSWLYGTVHVSRPEWLLPGAKVRAALEGSPLLALELDPGDPELARVFATVGDAARARRVTAGLDPRIAKLAARECVPLARIANLQPLLQLATLGLAETRRDGFHPELAIDAMLWGLARQEGKQVVGLETPASQLAALTPDSEADERVLLTRSLAEIETGEGRATLLRLLDAWATSDVEALDSYRDWCECMDTPEESRYLTRLNDERNAPMADKLAALQASGQSFFAAVGSLHMTGPQALPKLLRARGFQVERVPFAPASSKP